MNDFRYVSNNETICSSVPSHQKLLLVFVHVSRDKTRERLLIRDTWGSGISNPGWTRRLVFLIGLHNPALNTSQEQVDKEDNALEEESANFGDIVQGNFVDSYRNLTYKHLMLYKWTLEYCQQAEYVIRTDDDFFLDLQILVQLREEDLKKEELKPNMLCISFEGKVPLREPKSKWHVTKEEYESDIYPNFCYGAYGITVELIHILYSVHRNIPYFWVDVFVTGLLVEEALREFQGTSEEFMVPARNGWSLFTWNPEWYSTLCHTMSWQARSLLGAIVSLKRRDELDEHMRCLWNLTKVERKESTMSLIE